MINNVSDERVGDFAYFDALNAELDGGGIEAMMYDLLRLDLGNWHPKQIYKTAALMEQKQRSLGGLDAWIETLLQRGSMPETCSSKYLNRCLSKALEAEAKEYDRYTNLSRVVAKLKEVFGKDRMTDFNNQLARGWAFPPLWECRQAWEARHGGSWNWHSELREWGGP
jgi:hypothetical protein